MPDRSIESDFLFTLFEVQRLLRLFADKQASRYGLNRAQWAVLAKLERTEGLKQADVAELMEMQPITLTRLIDKLCKAGLIERTFCETDRRVSYATLLPAGAELLEEMVPVVSAELELAFAARLTEHQADDLRATLDALRGTACSGE